MSKTMAFKTKSEVIERKMPRIIGNNQHQGKTIIALDGGYSSVKGVSPERFFCFPSYAKRIERPLETVGQIKSFDIQMKNNKTGEIWLVGQSAQALMDTSDIDSTTDASLYTRYRYNSDIFKAIMTTGLAIGCIGAGDNEIILQTGLPSLYKERDENKLKDVLMGDYDISIKIGTLNWLHFVFTLKRENINVMEQPQGTLCGCAYGNEGVTVEGIDILKSNTIILDVGFETEDILSIKSGYNNGHKTYSDTAMKSVFEKTLKELSNNYPIETKIFELQNYLDDGLISVFDSETLSFERISFEDILIRINRELCEKSIRRLLLDYDNLLDYKYLIITGGTGESRYEQIKEMLKNITTLKVIPANKNNPEIPFSYSNVLGYYAFRHAKLKKDAKLSENSTT